MVDAEQLRSRLDRLRDALATPPIVSPMSGAFDRARITETLRCIADATRGVDVDARRSLTGVTPAVGLSEETKRLRVLVEQLHAAWDVRFVDATSDTLVEGGAGDGGAERDATDDGSAECPAIAGSICCGTMACVGCTTSGSDCKRSRDQCSEATEICCLRAGGPLSCVPRSSTCP